MSSPLTHADLARYTELSVFRSDLTLHSLDSLCDTTREKNYAALTLPSSLIAHGAMRLEDSGVNLIAQIGFPHGLMHGDVKRFEAELCVDDGAQEFEFMGNLMLLTNGEESKFLREIRDVVDAVDGRQVRVALKWSALTEAQRKLGAQAVLDSGAHYLSTGPGFGEKPDDATSIHKWRTELGDKFWIKAAQPMGDEGSLLCLKAGAQRIGCIATIK